MSTIPETMKTISKDVQNTFEELVKLLLRKSLRPVLNPLGPNAKIVYNNYRGRFERGFIGATPDDNINKYSYIMTHDSLGWTDDILANFRAIAKFIKSSAVHRHPSGHAHNHNRIKERSKVAFSTNESKHSPATPINHPTQYSHFLNVLESRSMQGIISNKKASFAYTSDIPYTYSFKQLENIGKDIIDQTDPSIDGCDSAKMSTSMLRVRLYNLEQNLANLSVNHPAIYDAYIEMIRTINSVPRSKIHLVINLIAALSYQRWDDLPPSQQQLYINALGEEFITTFNSNELITILLQSQMSQLVLTSSYLYPLLKMLFIVFGYSRLVPFVTDRCTESMVALQDSLDKHHQRYRGASFRRGEMQNRNTGQRQDSRQSPNETYHNLCSVASEPATRSPSMYADPSEPDVEPVDPCVYEFIKLFGDLYPTIIGLMGGTEKFPPESIAISCNDIPENYDYLQSLPEYLWRFNDYSYCKYLENQSYKQFGNALTAKINSKAKYLHSI